MRAADVVVVVVPAFLWGAAFPAIKLALGALTPVELGAARVVLGALLLLGIAAFAGLPGLPRRDWALVVAVGLLGFPVYQVLTNLGLTRAPAGTGSLFVPLVPLVASLVAARLYAEPLGRRAFAGIAVASLGALLVVGAPREVAIGWGFVALAGATLAAGAYFAMEGRLLRAHEPRAVLTWTMVVGAAALLPWGAGVPGALLSASPEALAAIGFLVVFPTVVAFGVLAWGLRRASTAQATSGIVLIPVFAFLVAWPLLGETPSWTDLVGGGIAIVGVALAQPRRGRAKRAHDEAPGQGDGARVH